ncbi:MAG: MmgE/PrpD family, partial [Rhodoferax sp.]|nr:MmgE/PrpD family [Rhodoferax sp.]
MNTPTALQQLAASAVRALPEIPAEALHAARRCLVDWLGVALAGQTATPVRLLRQALGGAASPDLLGAPALAAYADAWV